VWLRGLGAASVVDTDAGERCDFLATQGRHTQSLLGGTVITWLNRASFAVPEPASLGSSNFDLWGRRRTGRGRARRRATRIDRCRRARAARALFQLTPSQSFQVLGRRRWTASELERGFRTRDTAITGGRRRHRAALGASGRLSGRADTERAGGLTSRRRLPLGGERFGRGAVACRRGVGGGALPAAAVRRRRHSMPTACIRQWVTQRVESGLGEAAVVVAVLEESEAVVA
jgi:hypothetical protein